MTGKIKTLKLDKGFGFATAEDGQDYFVHSNDLVNRDFELLFPGSPVEFEGVSTSKGLRATQIRRR